MTRCVALSLILFLSIQDAIAFVPAASIRTQASSTSNINLVPEQGRQLVAFSQDYFAKKAKESASKASHLSSSRHKNGFTTAARNLVTRLVGKETRNDDEMSHAHRVDDEHVVRDEGGAFLSDDQEV